MQAYRVTPIVPIGYHRGWCSSSVPTIVIDLWKRNDWTLLLTMQKSASSLFSYAHHDPASLSGLIWPPSDLHLLISLSDQPARFPHYHGVMAQLEIHLAAANSIPGDCWYSCRRRFVSAHGFPFPDSTTYLWIVCHGSIPARVAVSKSIDKRHRPLHQYSMGARHRPIHTAYDVFIVKKDDDGGRLGGLKLKLAALERATTWMQDLEG
jgi:hypothetical protein